MRVDAQGRILAYELIGGVLSAARHVVPRQSTIYRFGGRRSPREVAKGGWWLEKQEFEQIINFANVHRIFVGLAVRSCAWCRRNGATCAC